MAHLYPEQYVTLQENNLYPSDKRQKTRIVTKRYPAIIPFRMDKRNAHMNYLVNHRYQRAEHRANMMPNPGSPKDVNKYIDTFRTDGMDGGKISLNGKRRDQFEG